MHASNKIIIFSSDSRSLAEFRGDLIRELLQKGCDVFCYCPYDKNFDEVCSKYKQKGVPVSQFDFSNASKNPFKDLIRLWKLYILLRQEKPTHILPFHIKPVLYSGLCSLVFPQIKVYPTIAGLGYIFMSEQTSTRFLRKIIVLLYKIVFKRSTKVFFHNQDDLKMFVEDGILSSEKAVLLNGSGVDTKSYKFTNLPPELSFIFIGRALKDKGLYEYMEACASIKKENPEVTCRLICSHSSNPSAILPTEIQSLCDTYGIEYIGEVSDVRPWLEKSSVFVLPSYREGLPRAGLEALSVGRPIITTNVPGCREIVVDQVNGYLIPAQDSETLAEAMRKMIVNHKSLSRMGEESRKLAESRFDVDKVNKVILDNLSF